jgi:hypothetical protein
LIISYCKYYYENFDKFSDNEKNDFLKIINENIIYLLAQELNKNQNKTKNEILKNKDFVHKKDIELIDDDMLSSIILNKNETLFKSVIKDKKLNSSNKRKCV